MADGDARMQILRNGNEIDLKACSICFEAYTVSNPVYVYPPCQTHLLCENCTKIYSKTKCQTCGKIGSEYIKSAELTQLVTGIKQTPLPQEELITFNIVSMSAVTHPITIAASSTFEKLLKYVEKQKGMTIFSLTSKNKVYKPKLHGDMTLNAMGIGKGVRVICITNFDGGVA